MPEDQLDLTDWLGSLRSQMAEVDAVFRAAVTNKERQYCAFAGLTALVSHARELPGVKSHLASLEALAHSLDELTKGRQPVLLENQSEGAGARPLTTSEEIVKAKAVAFVDILVLSKWPEKEASRMVADWFAAAGVVGNRGKQPVGQSTIRWWRTDVNSGDHPGLRAYADLTIANFKELSAEWPLSKDAAEALLSLVGRAPSFQHLIGTPPRQDIG